MSAVEQPVALVLGSASPRRREILGALGLVFRVVASEVGEDREPGEAARSYVERLAREKAMDVAARVREELPSAVVLGADTIVVVDGDILGKPTDDAQAREMIARLAGRAHEVTTAVALVAASGGGRGAQESTTTRVWFRALSPAEVARYVASGDGRDKAGAYAVQGLGSGLVTRVEGSYSNVVGLPAAETLALLRSVGAVGNWP